MADFLLNEDGSYLLEENSSRFILRDTVVQVGIIPLSSPTYRIVVRDLSGNTIGEIDRFKNLTFQKVLNREGDFSFDMSLLDAKANSNYIAHREREVYIYRNDQIVFGGIMIQDDGTTNWTDDVFTVRGKGFFETFQHRYTDPNSQVTFSADAGSIAWSLINTSQGLSHGNAGITEGAIATSVTRTPNYQKTQVYQAIIDMCSDQVDNGFDFEITQTKVFNVYYPFKGTDKSGSISFIGGKNISRVDFTHDHSNPINEAIVEGAGSGYGTPIVVVDDTSLQTTYGLLQGLVSKKDTDDTSILTDKGNQYLQKYGIPRRQYTLYQTPSSDPDWTTLDVGDFVRVDLDRGFLTVHDKVRLTTLQVTYNDGVETPQYIFLYN